MNKDPLSHIRIVLIGTTHPGNIGAAARAMKTMRLLSLYLVSPAIYPSAEATARAAGADDILANAVICDSLRQAVGDCQIVIGTSARSRNIPWPAVSPRVCAEQLFKRTTLDKVAILFGTESSGLTNDELETCGSMIQIPTHEQYSSLNIAAAVQIICYELMTAAQIGGIQTEQLNTVPLATQEQMAQFYRHLRECMIDIGYLDPHKPRKLMRRMKRLFNRARLDENELSIMRGLLSAAQSARPDPP